MLSQHGHVEEAICHVQLALDLAEEADSPVARARALNNSGWYNALAGKSFRTLDYSQQACVLYRELNDPRGEAYALFFLGYAYHQLGEQDRAIAHYHESLALKRSLSDRYRQAMAYDHLGDAYRAAGDAGSACAAWQNALDILAHLGVTGSAEPGYPDVGVIRAKLRDVDPAAGASEFGRTGGPSAEMLSDRSADHRLSTTTSRS
jgi:tetratricopeptide (TPR) repeat protein